MGNVQFAQQAAKAHAIFGNVDRVRRRAPDRHARCVQAARQIDRRLSAELHDHTFHLRAEGFIRTGELLERKARHFDHAIIDAGVE